jgi:hypothetical protein
MLHRHPLPKEKGKIIGEGKNYRRREKRYKGRRKKI